MDAEEKEKKLQQENKKACEITNGEKEFIERKYQKLLIDKGIILLKPMTSERRKRIYSIVDNYKDMVAFSIGDGEYKQVVLRYKPYIKERLDFKKLINDGNDAYNNQNYDKCINCYLQILSFGNPKSIPYSKLGLAYMKKFNTEKAIQYLTIATYLAKENNEQFDFTELIDKLKGNNPEMIKPKFTMKEKDFQNDLEERYNIGSFEEINNLIINTGLDVDSACERLNISEEHKIRIKLLYAKLYYSYGEYQIGDAFVDDIEKIKNKSQFVKKELEVIRKNRKFYINREKSGELKLSLTLKTKK